MNNTFLETNLLDSKNLSEVKNYTIIESRFKGSNTGYFFDYYNINDEKYSDQWTHGNFGYSMNEYGFRFEEMPKKCELAAFGCSYTFGLGLPTHMLFHQIVAEKLGITCHNFGVAGSSIKTVVDLFLITSKHIQISTAIFLLPSLNRLQIAKLDPDDHNIKYLTLIPGVESKLAKYFEIDSVGITKYIPDEEVYKSAKEQLYLLDLIGKSRGVKIFCSSWDYKTCEMLQVLKLKHIKLLPNWVTPPELQGDVARDKSHPGINHHKFFADRVIDFIK